MEARASNLLKTEATNVLLPALAISKNLSTDHFVGSTCGKTNFDEFVTPFPCKFA